MRADLVAVGGRRGYVIDAGARVRHGIGVTSPGLLDVLADTAGVRLTAAPQHTRALLAAVPSDATLVLTVRDAHIRSWQADLVAAALNARPDTVVVGMGTDADADLAPGRYLAAYGCGRVNLLAVAELLGLH